MSMTLNAAVCLRKQKTKCSFRNSLARNWKAAQKPSVRTTHRHGKWVALTPPEQILWAIGKEALRAKEWIQTQHETQNLCTVLTEQLTKKCLYTPCRENAGTNMRAGTGDRLAVCNWSCLDATPQVLRQIPAFFPLFLSHHRSEGTTLTALLWQKGPGPKVSWSHGCCSQKHLSWRRRRTRRWCVSTEWAPLCQCAAETMEISALQKKSSWGISVEWNAKCHKVYLIKLIATTLKN